MSHFISRKRRNKLKANNLLAKSWYIMALNANALSIVKYHGEICLECKKLDNYKA